MTLFFWIIGIIFYNYLQDRDTGICILVISALMTILLIVSSLLMIKKYLNRDTNSDINFDTNTNSDIDSNSLFNHLLFVNEI